MGSSSHDNALGPCFRSYDWRTCSDHTIHPADHQPLAYCVVGETSSTRLRAKTVGISRNLYVSRYCIDLADEQLQYNLSHLKRPQYVSDESNRLGNFSDLSEIKADL